MTSTLAPRTLLALAAALALSAGAAPALASAGSGAGTGGAGTGGASAPSGAHAAKNRKPAKSAASHGAQIATWFGPGFYGQKTACGQTLTPQTVGVASRTLPCGTLVLVNYSGHHLTVPVIDRGPYGHNGATWDLTWGAASALGISDTVRIKTKVVGSAPNSPLLGMPPEAQAALQAAAAAGGTSAS